MYPALVSEMRFDTKGATDGKTVDVTPFVRFAMLDASVATVDQWGLVCAKKPGKADVTATINGSAATASVIVESL